MSVFHCQERPVTLALKAMTLSLGLGSVFKPGLVMELQPRNREGRGLWIGMAGLFLTLWLIRHFDLDYKHAVAYTLILCGFFWNGTGAVVLGVLGTVAWGWRPALLLC